MVIWIIGLSGAGKTTIGRLVYNKLKAQDPATVFLDGDDIRRIFKSEGNEDYTLEGRKKNANRICEICAMLDRQGINVVCCILSIFEESRQWNRANYSEYFEVYISVPGRILREQRDHKNLYASALRGEIKNVVGVDIPFKKPEAPDFIFDNSAKSDDLSDTASEILKRAGEKFRNN